MKSERFPHPATFLPWLVAASSLLWLKRDLLIAFPLVPMRGGPINNGFTAQLACYRMDVLLLFVIIPLAFAVLFYFIPRSWHLPVIVVAGVLIEVVVYAEGRSLQMVGEFASMSLLLSAISWGTSGSEALDYVPMRGLIKLAVAVFVVVICALMARWIARRNAGRSSSAVRTVAAAYFAIALLVSLACWAVPAPATPQTTNILSIVAKSWVGADTAADRTKGLQSKSVDELIATYRQLANAPVTHQDPHYWGKAKGQNVIFFVWETGPDRDLGIAGDLKDYPNIARLRQQALVGDNHHSTYPYTNRAYISIYTSLYPAARKNFQSFPHQRLPGVMSSLRDAGYQTAIFGHLWTGETDSNMFKSLGFTDIAIPQGGLDSGEVPWPQKIQIDHGALEMLESQTAQWNQERKNFAAVFVPNVGHGPWPDMSNDGGKESIDERGRALWRLADAWLGELLQSLEKNHMLSNTVIVFTADHGIRDRTEDPRFSPGMIDDYSFHVPLLIYCPAAFPTRTDIPWLTSHIDIAPTLLDLLGIESGRSAEEGAPVWQEDLRNRTTFFLASHYLGSDGYFKDGKYYMVKYLSNAVYGSDKLHFGSDRLSGPEADSVSNLTSEMNAIEAAIFYEYSFEKQYSYDESKPAPH